MDMTDENCSPVIVTNGAYPVRCTEEVLLPFITEESQQAAMDPQLPPEPHGVPSALPELRLVLLGRKGAGKSAAGNTILGGVGCFESGKPTEECVKRRADVGGRKVTVVDTPGWEWYYPLNSTPNWVRRETLRSVSLCPPGPHAVLLVVRSCASITEGYIREIEEHLGPLGKGVWEHTMLLFTRGDELGLASMEQRISTSGPGLQRLLQKCGNKYHVVDNRSKGGGTQVRELMRKLEEMVEGKKDGSSHLEMDNTVLVGLEADGKRRARERRKKQRQMEAQLQRGTIKAALMSDGLQGELDAHQSFSKAPRRLPEVRLVLLGERETGKSSAGNAILGKVVFFQAGAVTEECLRRQAEVGMRLVTVVDTPGWEGGVGGATPERVKRELVSSVALCPPGPHALLLTLRVDTLVRAAHVKEHLELLGEGAWRHTILLFTHGDQLREGVDIQQHVQGGGRDLQGLLEKCRGRYHVISSVDGGGGGGGSEVTELLQKVEKMAAMNRCEAFCGLVQEVRDLSRHRNERFNQRLKDVGDKMLRQEDELKNMREREVKRMSWFFDRKKKVKSPGKADVQREEEEEEDGRMGERKNDIGELEERMRWLTEDKEREIQDLSVENERIRAALNQSRGERRDATLKLELRERESEELKERIDEQQLKLLDLERAVVENEHERKQREDTIETEKLKWMSEVKKLEESVESLKKEKAEWMEDVASLKAEMDETKRRNGDILLRKEQEKDREMAEMEEKLKREMDTKLLEKDKEREEMREKASEEKQTTLDNAKQYEKAMQREVEDMKLQHREEIEKKMHERETEIRGLKLQHQEAMARKVCEMERMVEIMKVQHREEISQSLKDNKEDIERVKQQHANEMKDTQREQRREVAELKGQFAKETEEQRRAKEREIAELEQRYLVHTDGNEKEKETIHLNHKKDLQEIENKLEVLKLQHREEMERKMKEMEELKEKQEDVERVHQQCSDEIRDIEQERQREIKELKQEFAEAFEKQLEERRREIRELGEKHRAQTEEKMLENEKEKKEMKENHEKYIRQKLQERDGLIEELKRQHVNELKEVTRGSDQEKETLVMKLKEETEQRLEEKERETEEMKVNVREMKEKLQQKEEKENDHLHFKRVMEQRLEERERETEVMRGHSKELERRLRKTEEERERDHLNHKKLMEEKMQEQEELSQHIKDIGEILQRKDEERGEIMKQKKEAERRLQEAEETKRELLNDLERKLSEKEGEIESVKQQAESRERRWREEQRKKDETGERELERLLELVDQEATETTRSRRLLSERDGELEEAKKTLAASLKEIEELSEIQRRKDAETMERLREKEEELRRRDGENEREVARLRLTIEQTKAELKELTGRMEKEMTSMILEYEKEVARRNESVEESRRRVEELEEDKEKMREEMERLGVKCAELKEREEEVRKHLVGYEAKMQGVLKERDVEVEGWREENDKLKVEIERMKEGQGEEEMQTLERENKVGERERLLSRRGNELDVKETELVGKEGKLESKEEELSKREASLEKRQREQEENEQEVRTRAETLEERERELESLLGALEGRQKELNYHGQDLQEKVRGLKDHGKELEDRECYLRSEEQELISWKSELQMKDEHVISTTQQLDEMGRDLALLKEELHTKERNLKASLKKLGKWEQDLKRREEGLLGRERRDVENGQDEVGEHESDPFDREDDLMYREVSERRGKGGGGGGSERGDKEKEDRCHLETVEAVETAEPVRICRGQNVAKGVQDVSTLPGSDLRVVVLRESWSSRSPAGVTILFGEPSEPDGSTFRHWRGPVAGRRLAVAEPLGLRWRDGPDPTDAAAQRTSVLDGASWCRPGPHAVLLLLPAFLTCTQKYRRAVEGHMALLGEGIWRRTLVLFTWGEMLGERAEQHILRNGELAGLVERCGGGYHVLSNRSSNASIEGLLEKMEDMTVLNTGEL